jgi:general secretion pathway protein I
MENSLLAEKLEAPMKIECFYQQPGTSSQKPACGFTLIEVSVAVLIMSIVLVSIYKMHSQSIAMNTEARFYTQAPMLAQGKLAELETSTEDEIAADSGDFGENYSVDIEALGEISEDLQRIDVTVSYNNGEFDYRFRTYRFTRK